MHAVARQALEKVFESAERAETRESVRSVTLPFTRSRFPAYSSLGLRAEVDEVHAALREAERAGAIEIEWDVRAGDGGQVKRIRLLELPALAELLGRPLTSDLVSEAESALGPWRGNPRVRQILAAWRALRKPRGRGVEAVDGLIDALRVLDYCAARQGEDIAVRAASAALFRSSKRIEEHLIAWLDLLTADAGEDLSGTLRPAEEVLAHLGLVKHPPAVMLAGPATLILQDGARIEVPAPFVGLAPSAVSRVELPRSVEKILTVENLTPFHELAAGRAGRLENILVVYTAGMPAPSFLRFYRALLESAPGRHVLHWGDIDLGGFRIARILAGVAAECGTPLTLWRMRADEHDPALSYRKLSDAEVRELQKVCTEQGWEDEGRGIESCALGFEQEALALRLP